MSASADQPTIAVLGTLDSKHEVVRFVCDALRAADVRPWLLDLSLRPHRHAFADCSGGEVATAAGTDWEALGRLSRAEAATIMSTGGLAMIEARHRGNGVAGVLGIGGANGATMSCAIMRALPIGLPKAMVTPVAATAAVQWYVAESDIAMFPTIGDISLNRITRAALGNAAAAIAGMARRARAQPRRRIAGGRR